LTGIELSIPEIFGTGAVDRRSVTPLSGKSAAGASWSFGAGLH
jgi:hypothetical protein